MRSFILNSAFIIAILFTAVSPSWAIPVNTDIEILNRGPGSGFNYSLIHSANCSGSGLCMSGSTLYGNGFFGTLNGNLDLAGPLTLNSITGLLMASQGNVQFTGGFLNASNGGGLASGQLDYNFLSGNLQGETGTFYFLATQLCCNAAPYGGPNHFTSDGITLWGNNWDITANNGLNSRQAVLDAGFTPLGIDLVGGQYSTPKTTATPEPTSLLLLGSGIAGLLYWRKKR